jgi:hypothetical protein
LQLEPRKLMTRRQRRSFNAPPLDKTPPALPRLPDELQYRAVGVALILVDTHANLVVDVLHAVFPPP